MRGSKQLYRDYGAQGLVILGFPCNQFAGQEPGSAEEIAEFCEINYGVTFPLFAKLDVNGPGESPLYTWLKAKFPGDIEWNFAKFLIARDGQVAERFAPDTVPKPWSRPSKSACSASATPQGQTYPRREPGPILPLSAHGAVNRATRSWSRIRNEWSTDHSVKGQ